MARIISSPLAAAGTTATDAAGRCEATGAGREAATAGAAPIRGALGAWGGAPAPTAGAGAAGTAVGPPGGRVGSLIVGAADGFGGKLIRTVSFLGWTFPVSFFGGTAPPGMLGMFSAICLLRP